MWEYILKRLFLSIPVLLAISLLLFFLRSLAPPETLIAETEVLFQGPRDTWKQEAIRKSVSLGLHQPSFYFSLASPAFPDSFFYMPDQKEKEWLRELTCFSGNWKVSVAYLNEVKLFKAMVEREMARKGNNIELEKINETVKSVEGIGNPEEIRIIFFQAQHALKMLPNLEAAFLNLSAARNSLEEKKHLLYRLIPFFHFHGTRNQYHDWISGIFSGNWGVSWQDGRPVKTILGEAMPKTLLVCFPALFLSLVFSIPIGVWLSGSKSNLLQNSTSNVLLAIHSMPSFWLATMMLVIFGRGGFLHWFPSFGLGDTFSDWLYHLVLPVSSMVLGLMAYISSQVRNALNDELTRDYIQTARAKGVEESNVKLSHAFRNSLFPLITIIGGLVPVLFSGSFIIENVFSIPGLGMITFGALETRNYPVVFASVMITALATVAGLLLADLLYLMADPRLRIASDNLNEKG